jgi:hypothetical protein
VFGVINKGKMSDSFSLLFAAFQKLQQNLGNSNLDCGLFNLPLITFCAHYSSPRTVYKFQTSLQLTHHSPPCVNPL